MSVAAHAFTLPVPVHATPIALHIDDETSFTDWAMILLKAAKISSGSAWWVGDALVYGEVFAEQHGTDYDAAITATQLAYDTLRQYKSVAARFPVARRRTTLSWSHHLEVVSLDRADQEMWLNRAEAEQLSQKALREAVRCVGAHTENGGGTLLVPFSLKTDGERVERWRAAAAAAGLKDGKGEPDLRTWALNVLDEAAA